MRKEHDDLEVRAESAPDVQTGGTQSKFSIGKIEVDGVYASAAAGGILLFVEMIAGGGFFTPLQYAASVIMAEHAFDAPVLLVMIAGLGVHAAACGVFGFIYGVVASLEPPSLQESPLAQAWRGSLFGALIYLVNFQVIARLAYPWFNESTPLVQFALHVIAYGLPMGIMYARLRRHRTAVEPLRAPSMSRAAEETSLERGLTQH